MDIAIKLAQVIVPLIIELIKQVHPEKSDEEHKQIASGVIGDAVNNWNQQ